eukprot:6462298-Amphidinium_carterae.1
MPELTYRRGWKTTSRARTWNHLSAAVLMSHDFCELGAAEENQDWTSWDKNSWRREEDKKDVRDGDVSFVGLRDQLDAFAHAPRDLSSLNALERLTPRSFIPCCAMVRLILGRQLMHWSSFITKQDFNQPSPDIARTQSYGVNAHTHAVTAHASRGAVCVCQYES